ncbi:MAG: hypothetical protein IKX21_06855 [Deltaproteobacteria bacterium]|nr:hypothetical protein [Deltaproteobacteria bacterium]
MSNRATAQVPATTGRRRPAAAQDATLAPTASAISIETLCTDLAAAVRKAGLPSVNVYLTGCNINNGGQQIVGNSNVAVGLNNGNLQVGQNTYGTGPDLQQWQAATIQAQAATIAAQQRTIDRLISMLEQRTPGHR